MSSTSAIAETESTPLMARPSSLSTARQALLIILLVLALERTVFYYFFIDAVSEFDYANQSCNPLADFNVTQPRTGDGPFIKKLQFEFINSVAYILPVLGGLLGDGVLGRFNTLLLGSAAYLLATILFTFLISIPAACTLGLHLGSIAVLCLAVGLVRSNLLCLGVRCSSALGINFPQYFLWYYVALGTGQTLGHLLLFVPQQEENLFPLLIALVTIWTVLLIIFRKCYNTESPNLLASVLHNMVCFCRLCQELDSFFDTTSAASWAVVGGAVYRRRQEQRQRTRERGEEEEEEVGGVEESEEAEYDSHAAAMQIWRLIWHFVNYILQVVALKMATYTYAKELLYMLQETSYIQAQYHKLLLWIPNAACLVVGSLLILVLIKHGRLVCPFRRTLIGMVLLLCSFMVSLVVKVSLPGNVLHAGANGHWSKGAVVGILLPQTVMAGISEALVFSAGNEIAYTHSPKGIESFVVGLFNTVWGIGAFFALGMTHMFRELPSNEPWLPDVTDHSSERFQFVFAVMIAAMAVNICGYIPSMAWIKRRNKIRKTGTQNVILNDY